MTKLNVPVNKHQATRTLKKDRVRGKAPRTVKVNSGTKRRTVKG